MFKIIVFVSGSGTNLQTIIDCCKSGVLNASVIHVVSNKSGAYALERAKEHSIPTSCFEYKRGNNRSLYDKNLAEHINSIGHDLIVLAGWMHILGSEFLKRIKSQIINLHPALPGEFPGKDAIKHAYNAFKRGDIKRTGIMIHNVVEEIDAGKVIEVSEVPIYPVDSYENLESRVRFYEKYALIRGIEKIIGNWKSYPLVYRGKVRDVYGLGNNLLAFIQSDRQSAFDRHICEIPGKGQILTEASRFWFQHTQNIIPNHYLYSKANVMICKKCEPFKVEIVVRGYMTGSTSTSLWTHYERGERVYCGIQFRDGYKKNEKLDEVVITPTTKGEKDELIDKDEIISRDLMSQKDRDYIYEIAKRLFEYGQYVSDSKGLILVDTKYEFGVDQNGIITLIDEIHTCDSSRFWLKDTYNDRMEKGFEPERFDKDIVREFVRSKCDPYTEDLPEIPNDLIKTAQGAYKRFYNLLTGNNISECSNAQLNDVVTAYFKKLKK